MATTFPRMSRQVWYSGCERGSVTYRNCSTGRIALNGSRYCYNHMCTVVGHLKDFKVCPQCKTARYCSDACQKQDWITGGHKATCGKAVYK